MTDRNNAPAGRLVPEVRVPTEKELREQNHPERDGKPMLLSSKWMVKAGLAMCDELLAVASSWCTTWTRRTTRMCIWQWM